MKINYNPSFIPARGKEYIVKDGDVLLFKFNV